MDFKDRAFYVNTIFFISWLIMIIIVLFWTNHRQLNKNYLLIGVALSPMILVANGVVIRDWVWRITAYVAGVDVFWIIAGAVLL